MDLDTLPVRLRTKINAYDDTGCWLWTAAKDRHGYGRYQLGRPTPEAPSRRKTVFAHRIVYELLVGDPGPELDHLCRIPACVNPAHLEPVTHRENILRGPALEAMNAYNRSKTHCPQGHPYEGDNLYFYVAKNGWVNRQCRLCKRDVQRRRRAAARP